MADAKIFICQFAEHRDDQKLSEWVTSYPDLVDTTDESGNSFLALASHFGKIDSVDCLIKIGANVNLQNQDGNSPLILATERGFNDVANMLLAAGASLNMQSHDTGITALMGAVSKGYISTATLLIERGADINIQAKNGRTALMIASDFGYTDIVRIIVEKGAKLDHKNSSGRTALMMASGHNYLDITKILLDANASIDSLSKNGWTALMTASFFGQKDTVELLLSRGADRSIEDQNGKTARHLALSKGHSDVAVMLESDNIIIKSDISSAIAIVIPTIDNTNTNTSIISYENSSISKSTSTDGDNRVGLLIGDSSVDSLVDRVSLSQSTPTTSTSTTAEVSEKVSSFSSSSSFSSVDLKMNKIQNSIQSSEASDIAIMIPNNLSSDATRAIRIVERIRKEKRASNEFVLSSGGETVEADIDNKMIVSELENKLFDTLPKTPDISVANVVNNSKTITSSHDNPNRGNHMLNTTPSMTGSTNSTSNRPNTSISSVDNIKLKLDSRLKLVEDVDDTSITSSVRETTTASTSSTSVGNSSVNGGDSHMNLKEKNRNLSETIHELELRAKQYQKRCEDAEWRIEELNEDLSSLQAERQRWTDATSTQLAEAKNELEKYQTEKVLWIETQTQLFDCQKELESLRNARQVWLETEVHLDECETELQKLRAEQEIWQQKERLLQQAQQQTQQLQSDQDDNVQSVIKDKFIGSSNTNSSNANSSNTNSSNGVFDKNIMTISQITDSEDWKSDTKEIISIEEICNQLKLENNKLHNDYNNLTLIHNGLMSAIQSQGTLSTELLMDTYTTSLEYSVNKFKSQISIFESDIKRYEIDRRELIDIIRSHELEIKELKQTQSKEAEIIGELEAYDEEVIRLRTECHRLQGVVEAMEESRMASCANIEALTIENKELLENLLMTKAQVTCQLTEVKKLEDLKHDLRALISKQQIELTTLQSSKQRTVELTIELENSRNEMTRLQAEHEWWMSVLQFQFNEYTEQSKKEMVNLEKKISEVREKGAERLTTSKALHAQEMLEAKEEINRLKKELKRICGNIENESKDQCSDNQKNNEAITTTCNKKPHTQYHNFIELIEQLEAVTMEVKYLREEQLVWLDSQPSVRAKDESHKSAQLQLELDKSRRELDRLRVWELKSRGSTSNDGMNGCIIGTNASTIGTSRLNTSIDHPPELSELDESMCNGDNDIKSIHSSTPSTSSTALPSPMGVFAVEATPVQDSQALANALKELDVMRSEVERLKAKEEALFGKESEIYSLKGVIDRLESEHRVSLTQMNELEQALENYETLKIESLKWEKSTKEIISLRSEIDTLMEEQERWMETIKKLESYRNEVKTLQDEKKKWIISTDALESYQIELMKLRQEKEKWSNTISEFEQIRTELILEQGRNEDLTRTLSHAKSEVTRMSKAQQLVSVLQGELTLAKTNIEQGQQREKELMAEVTSLRDSASLIQHVEDLNYQNNDLIENLTMARGQVTCLQGEMSRLNEIKNELKATIYRQQLELTAIKNDPRITLLESELEAYKREVEGLQEERELHWNETVKALEISRLEIEDLRVLQEKMVPVSNLTECENEISRLNDSMNCMLHFKSELDETKIELSRVKIALIQSEEVQQNLQKEIEKSNIEKQTLESKLLDVENSRSEIALILKNTIQELETCQEELKKSNVNEETVTSLQLTVNTYKDENLSIQVRLQEVICEVDTLRAVTSVAQLERRRLEDMMADYESLQNDLINIRMKCETFDDITMELNQCHSELDRLRSDEKLWWETVKELGNCRVELTLEQQKLESLQELFSTNNSELISANDKLLTAESTIESNQILINKLQLDSDQLADAIKDRDAFKEVINNMMTEQQRSWDVMCELEPTRVEIARLQNELKDSQIREQEISLREQQKITELISELETCRLSLENLMTERSASTDRENSLMSELMVIKAEQENWQKLAQELEQSRIDQIILNNQIETLQKSDQELVMEIELNIQTIRSLEMNAITFRQMEVEYKQSIEKLQNEVEIISKKYFDLQEELKQTQIHINIFENEKIKYLLLNSTQERQIQEYYEIITNLESNHLTLKGIETTLVNELERCRLEITNLKDEQIKWMDTKCDLERCRLELKFMKTELSKSIELEVEVEKLRAEVIPLRSVTSKCKDLENELETLRIQTKILEEQLARLTGATKELEQARQELEYLKGERLRYKETLIELEQSRLKIDSLETEIATLQNDLDLNKLLVQQATEDTKRVTSVTNEIENNRQEMELLKQKLSNSIENEKNLQKQLKDLQIKTFDYEHELERHTETSIELESYRLELEYLKGERMKYKDTIIELELCRLQKNILETEKLEWNKKITELTNEINDKYQKTNDDEKSVEDLKNQLSISQANTKLLMGTLSALEGNMEVAQSRLLGTLHELDNSRHELITLKKNEENWKETSDELDKYRQENYDMSEELKKYQIICSQLESCFQELSALRTEQLIWLECKRELEELKQKLSTLQSEQIHWLNKEKEMENSLVELDTLRLEKAMYVEVREQLKICQAELIRLRNQSTSKVLRLEKNLSESEKLESLDSLQQEVLALRARRKQYEENKSSIILTTPIKVDNVIEDDKMDLISQNDKIPEETNYIQQHEALNLSL